MNLTSFISLDRPEYIYIYVRTNTRIFGPLLLHQTFFLDIPVFSP